MTPALELAGIDKSFTLPSGERLDILRGLDLAANPGEIVAIVGRSGSGKSTLLNLIGLLDTPTRGSYRLAGTETTRLRDGQRSRLRGETLGFIFQQFHLLDRRTALENVAEPLLFAASRQLAQRHHRAQILLDRVGLADRAGSMPHLLSGGEQQRVAIARALVRSPRVVLADEPTGALDEATGDSVLDLLATLAREEGVTLILVTHDQAVANRADRVLTLHNGRLDAETHRRGDPRFHSPGRGGDWWSPVAESTRTEDSSQARNDNRSDIRGDRPRAGSLEKEPRDSGNPESVP